MSTSLKLKSILYNKCLENIDNRINNIQRAYNDANESGNDETKSSAGDKHETGRAMMQIEQEKVANQLMEACELKKSILRINPDQYSQIISVGSIVVTNNGSFYISISAGKIEINKSVFFAISPQSPIALKLLGLKVDDRFSLNELDYKILEVH